MIQGINLENPNMMTKGINSENPGKMESLLPQTQKQKQSKFFNKSRTCACHGKPRSDFNFEMVDGNQNVIDDDKASQMQEKYVDNLTNFFHKIEDEESSSYNSNEEESKD